MKVESYCEEFNDLIDPETTVEKISDGFSFTEGTIWDDLHNQLYH